MNESKTWTEAQGYCRQNYTDLATIDNMEEMNRLINTVNGSFIDSAWIGLYDDVNSWRWSLEDNDFYQEGERDFRNFYHEPDNAGNELCVYMDSNGNWFDYSCDNSFTFVCYDGKTFQLKNYFLYVHTAFTLITFKGTYYAKITFIRCLNTVVWPQCVKKKQPILVKIHLLVYL